MEIRVLENFFLSALKLKKRYPNIFKDISIFKNSLENEQHVSLGGGFFKSRVKNSDR